MTITSVPHRYAVIGNPVEHSRSPFIHGAFAQQTGKTLVYDRLLAPIDGFAQAVNDFFAQGGGGLNVTVPFKEQACKLAQQHLSSRAQLAGAVNTLWMEHGQLHGCNTDGVGLLDDLRDLGFPPRDRNVLLIGAGGAARGVIFPLLEAGCAQLRVINRSPDRAHQLRDHVLSHARQFRNILHAGSLDEAGGPWDIVINATSSSLGDKPPALPPGIYASGALAYDMMYGAQPTPFMRQAASEGAAQTADGLGMLVAQAAASFLIWHGVMPDVQVVLNAVRRQLAQG
ncbi:shikimate dehydrogenase [Allopusillimonas ginsengisoli]|uniref:shikimate dehydrogenase n=1 Tax=Allopusillimonas ginsengisoli TaxID=453575 RepID=UPI0026B246C7